MGITLTLTFTSFGILLGVYFTPFMLSILWLVWTIFVVPAIWMIYKIIKYVQ